MVCHLCLSPHFLYPWIERNLEQQQGAGKLQQVLGRGASGIDYKPAHLLWSFHYLFTTASFLPGIHLLAILDP